MAQVVALVDALKAALKTSRITYAGVAAVMGVS